MKIKSFAKLRCCYEEDFCNVLGSWFATAEPEEEEDVDGRKTVKCFSVILKTIIFWQSNVSLQQNTSALGFLRP